jgi:RNA polymerase sigma-70 factor (ECF subfamily)
MTRFRFDRSMNVTSSSPSTEATSGDGREQELIARVRQGDAEAFEEIFRTQWQPMYDYAFRYLHAADDAEDAVQTVFTRIWRARGEWRVVGVLGQYLYLAVRNACLDRIQRDAVSRHWREKQVDALRDEDVGAPSDAEELLAASDLEAAMERALASLTPKQREVYLLRIKDGITYPEIGRLLGISTKTVENHLAAAYKYLRKALAEHR